MSGIRIDTERQMLREVDKDLKEWGRWSASQPGFGLGYPKISPFLQVRGKPINDYNMASIEAVEAAYSTWCIVVLRDARGEERRHRLLLQFILKVHYCEAGNVYDKAYHTGRRFRRRMSRSLYYLLLREARLSMATLLY